MLEIENEMKRVILFFTIKHKGNWEKIYNAIKTREDISLSEMNTIKEKYQNRYISIVDQQYPDNYKEIYMPPLSIFITGNAKLLETNNVIYSLWSANDYQQLVDYPFNKDLVYAVFLTPQLIPVVNQLSAAGTKFILINKNYANAHNIEGLIINENVVHLSEVAPETKNPDIAEQQNCERLLLGISKHAIAIDINTDFIKKVYPLFEFEKRTLTTSWTETIDISKCNYIKFAPSITNHKHG